MRTHPENFPFSDSHCTKDMAQSAILTDTDGVGMLSAQCVHIESE